MWSHVFTEYLVVLFLFLLLTFLFMFDHLFYSKLECLLAH
jgi:hypothetical protein